ncbi:MAG: CCA tRNA nucleotidyltransferase [Candidatus Cloacimonetes bacterium]|nr:CCA tRNA nucleotidyltransferase [Candidatus Cloacimonadota bacterium]
MFNIPQEVQYVMQQLNTNGYQSYLVGGCVRDMLLDKEPKDFDICTSALPDEIIKIFDKTVPTGLQHGTVTVLINHYPVEVTTMRKDGIYKDNRHPEIVLFTNKLEEDVMRRDFTINALAIDNESVLYDYVNGVSDLKQNTIKAVGNPNDRFKEDALRMMRAIRLACQLGFAIDNKTIKAIKINSSLLQNISIERVREELNRILISDYPSIGIRMLYQYGLLQYIIPELCICVGFDQNNSFHDKDIFEHTMTVLESIPATLELRLSALLHDIAKPQTFNGGHFYGHHMEGADLAEQILRRMKYDNQTIDKIKTLVFYHMDRYDNLSIAGTKRFINRIGIENIDDLFELQIADRKGCKPPVYIQDILNLKNQCYEILNKEELLTIKDLSINGYDLMELGIKPSKEMGNILDKLLEMVLENPELNNKDILLELVKKSK